MTWFTDVLGSFGGIGGSLIDNWNSNKRANKANEQSQANARQNYEWQKEFAQNGLKWNVQQAKELGLNPLSVTGGSSFTPSSAQVFSGDGFNFENNLSKMGQSVGRAINATMTRQERAKQEQLDALTLRNAQLKNDYIEVQIQTAKNQIAKNANSPALPKPNGTPDNPYPYYENYRDKYGRIIQLPSQQASQADQANWWQNIKTSANDFIDDAADSIYKKIHSFDHYFNTFGSIFNNFKFK